MKQTIAVLLIGFVFLMPIALAEASSKASAQGEARSVSVLDLRLKQVGEAFSDFVFKVKAALTFDNDAKLDLLKERDAELKARQQAWVETKQEAIADIKSSNMTAKQKQSIIAIFQAEHEAMIEDRLELTEDIREVQLEAKAEGDAELETEAEAEADAVEDDEAFLGIFIDIDLDSEARGSSKAESRSDLRIGSRVESEAEAKAVVRKKLGLEGTNVRTVVEDDTTFFVVSGTETEVKSDFTMTKEFEVWVDSETGMITSVDMETHIESRSEAEAETETSSASGSASASGSTKSSGKLKLGIFG